MWRAVALSILVSGVLALSAALVVADARAVGVSLSAAVVATPPVADTPAPPAPEPIAEARAASSAPLPPPSASAPALPAAAPTVAPTATPAPAPTATPTATPAAAPIAGAADPGPASAQQVEGAATSADNPSMAPAEAAPAPTSAPAPAPTPTPAPAPAPAPAPVHPSFAPLAQSIAALNSGPGGNVSVSLVELGGPAPGAWSLNGAQKVNAASTYKLPALMRESQLISSGAQSGSGQVCYQDGDWEDGWFTDYNAGECYTRSELAQRAAHFSDNTAGHMLVRDLGGSDQLNAFAASLGSRNSSFFNVNTTTSDDLASLLVAEASGRVGGGAGQAWLFPLLTHTAYESGIPAGVPATATVVHKTGELDPVVNDAAIVSGGRNGAYVLTVMTDGPGGAAGWSEIAQISAAVWQYESAR